MGKGEPHRSPKKEEYSVKGYKLIWFHLWGLVLLINIAFPFISTHFPSRTFVSFQLFSCPSHILSMSLSCPFFSFHVIQVARNPQIQELYFILAKPSIQEVFRSNLESFGHGYTPQEPEKQISKGSKESFSCFFLRGCPHFISLHVHSVPFVSCFPFLFHVLSWSEVGRFPKSTHNRSFPFLTFYLKRTRQKQSQHQLTWARGEPHRSPKVMRNQ